MAESVDALVSNTSGATRAGSTPALGTVKRLMTRWVSAVFLYANVAIGCVWVQWKNTGGLKQKHKKQPFSDASASHLSLALWHVWFQAEAWISHTTSPTPSSYEVGGIAKRIKTSRLRRKTNLQKSDCPKTRIKEARMRCAWWNTIICICIK